MSVSVRDIMQTFGVSRDKVRQQGCKQLFIVDLPTGRVLVSYKTIVGRFVNGEWYLTTDKYSVSTTRQMNQFSRSTSFSVHCVDDIYRVGAE